MKPKKFKTEDRGDQIVVTMNYVVAEILLNALNDLEVEDDIYGESIEELASCLDEYVNS